MKKTIYRVSWKEVEDAIEFWEAKIREVDAEIDYIFAITRGGVVPGFMLAKELGILDKLVMVKPFDEGVFEPYRGMKVVIVDDIFDSGRTMQFFLKEASRCDIHATAFYIVDKVKKIREGIMTANTWVVFPWETLQEDTIGGREQAVVALLRSVGEDPLREGLKDTPKRVAKMYDELCSGYEQDPETLLSTTFNNDACDEMVVLKDIPFSSLCEHHMLPFRGKVHFAYIPDHAIVGVSKIARLVECFARRLQIQERMTMEIGKAFEEVVEPKGVGVVVEAAHECMLIRGIKKEGSVMKTSYLGGAFKDEKATRDEFLTLIK